VVGQENANENVGGNGQAAGRHKREQTSQPKRQNK